jgi:aminopeptidase N
MPLPLFNILIVLIILFLLATNVENVVAQKLPYKITFDDTLRGTQSPMRICYDVVSYDLSVSVDIPKKKIDGASIIAFNVVADFDSLQIDLFSRYKIEKISCNNIELKYRRDHNSVFVLFPSTQHKGDYSKIAIAYSGLPPSVKNPEWEGGFTWRKDTKGRDWVGVACESTGASVWWPCKDQLADEPDTVFMHYTIASDLVCVANGRLIDTVIHPNNTTTWNWLVTYPINIYNITLNIGHYAHFTDDYVRGNEKLLLDYYVIDYNLSQAQYHFQQVKTMMACYEKYFGKYPFWNDGYKLVETPYWGMEHQSAVSYGNEYVNNKDGFDFIIIHESAHEWWGNNVSANDFCDMWIHESFATYAEVLYVECNKGYEDGLAYLKNLRWQIRDSFAIVGPRSINYDFIKVDNDLYFKGACIINTFRSVLNNDELFFKILKGIQIEFALQTISGNDLIRYGNSVSGKDFTAFFNQYLNFAMPPVFEFKTKQKGKNTQLTYRWKTDVSGFTMPIEITNSYLNNYGVVSKTYMRIEGTNNFQTVTIPNFEEKYFDVNSDRFYVRKEKAK